MTTIICSYENNIKIIQRPYIITITELIDIVESLTNIESSKALLKLTNKSTLDTIGSFGYDILIPYIYNNKVEFHKHKTDIKGTVEFELDANLRCRVPGKTQKQKNIILISLAIRHDKDSLFNLLPNEILKMIMLEYSIIEKNPTNLCGKECVFKVQNNTFYKAESTSSMIMDAPKKCYVCDKEFTLMECHVPYSSNDSYKNTVVASSYVDAHCNHYYLCYDCDKFYKNNKCTCFK